MTASMYTPRPGTQSTPFNLSGLSQLKREAQSGANLDTRKEIARQFEALFMQMMLKRMREASPGDTLLGSDQTRMVQSIADEQMAMHLATPGIGLANALLRQMSTEQAYVDPGRQATSLRSSSLDHRDAEEGVKLPSVTALLDSIGFEATYRKYAIATSRSSPFEPQQGTTGVRAIDPTTVSVEAVPNAPRHVVAFMARMAKAAHEASGRSGVPATLMLSQAALETGWGTREIKLADGTPTYNAFGIKAGSSWSGAVAHALTTEYTNGAPQKMLQPFKAYASYEAAFADYARIIGTHPRYRKVMEATNVEHAAHMVQEAGYASDPRYAEKLIKIMSLMQTKAKPPRYLQVSR